MGLLLWSLVPSVEVRRHSDQASGKPQDSHIKSYPHGAQLSELLRCDAGSASASRVIGALNNAAMARA